MFEGKDVKVVLANAGAGKTTYAVKDIMNEHLDEFQMQKLADALDICLSELFPEAESTIQQDYVKIFLAAKRVEGCSEKTARYYDSTIRNVLRTVKKEVSEINTEDLRIYLDNYQRNSGVSRVTITAVKNGKSCSKQTADKLVAVLGKSVLKGE